MPNPAPLLDLHGTPLEIEIWRGLQPDTPATMPSGTAGRRPGRSAALPAVLFAALLAGPALAAPGAPPPAAAAPASATAPAGATAPIPLSASQVQALGVRSEPVVPAAAGSGTALAHLPATVSVPVGQLRMVAAPAAGMVETVKVVPGQQVRKGDVLATFASPELLALQREASVARSQAELAASARRRDEALFAEGIIAAARLEATRANAAQAAAQAEEKRLALGVAGLPAKGGPSGAAALVAPLSGYVLEQLATPGQRVDAAAPLFSLADSSALGLEIQVAASLAALLPDGAPVRTILADGRTLRGKVVSVGRQVGAAQTVAVRASLERPGAGAASLPLRPGQAVEAEISLAGQAALAGAVRIPGAALTYRSGAASNAGNAGQATSAYVFVHEQEGLYRPFPVTVLGPLPGGWLVKPAGAIPFADKARVAVAGVAALKAAWLGQSGE
ncbi:hypothetical protein OTERR_03920 [Oryzomicrobium terrae]|uniref:CzcB-like barrel-sandwich hybrid domain-containing protein n=1 Tax=Oryzomicrobium terrae TaxID=1735038 RepID=A0A5C1E6F7_9RHOO|nr:efflux RND transporter periplasmic adaptor subunit [Oryzomicrobium terrae]QEL63868.1 hypothetical protein OTERR_03920 [Oryzomicrobium terrae]